MTGSDRIKTIFVIFGICTAVGYIHIIKAKEKKITVGNRVRAKKI